MARGWIEERPGKRGVSYRVRWIAVDRDGVERRHSETVASEEEAKRVLQIKLGEVASGLFAAPAKVTLRELVNTWLEIHGGEVSGSTLHAYRKQSPRFLDPLGDVPIHRLTPPRLQAVVNGLRERLAPNTVAAAWKPISGALCQAVAWGLLPVNPAKGVKLPRPDRAKPKAWTAEETARFLAAEGDRQPWGLAWRLMLATGMRKGELAALHWQDVDLARGEILIRRTATVDAAGARVIKERSKTGRTRAIALSATLVAALGAHHTASAARRLAAQPGTPAANLVFLTRAGGAVDRSMDRALGVACQRAGVPYYGPHGLRHTYATLELANGTHPKIVQERLGHSTIAMTLDTYSHVSTDLQRAAAERFDEFLRNAEREARGMLGG